jgi:YHS domain-containing protein
MLRYLLLMILITFIARAFWRVIDGVIDGIRGGTAVKGRPTRPAAGVPMVRDPVCGTFVVPERALTLMDRGRQMHFCSTRCRDEFVAHPHAAGRT